MLYREMMITISYCPSSKHQACATIEVDLRPYIQSIEKKLETPSLENLDEYESTYLSFIQLVHPIVSELRWSKWFDTAIEGTRLPKDIIQQIIQCPAYKILSNVSTAEILKNSMDECLFAYFDPLSKKKSHLVQLVMGIDVKEEDVYFQFNDSGRGFSESFLSHIQDNAHKAQYLCQSDSHRRQDKQDSELLYRSFGGHGIGLRELISLVQCGQPLLSIKENILPSSPESALKIVEEGMASNYRVEFCNQSGACIRVVTPYLESTVRDKSIVLPVKEAPFPEFTLKLPSFKSSIWCEKKKTSDATETLEFQMGS